MSKNKNGKVNSQIHLYSTPKLYNDFKEAVKQFNNTDENNYSISEILRVFMLIFTKNPTIRSIISKEIKIIQIDNNPKDILYNKTKATEPKGDVNLWF